MLRVGMWAESFRMRMYFTLALARWQVSPSTTFEILLLSTCTLCQQKAYISIGTQPLFEYLCLSSKMLRVRIWVETFRTAQVFYLCNKQWENSAFQQHLKFCHFQPVHGARKNPISPKGIQPIFEYLCLSSKLLRVGIWAESFRTRRYFTFCNGKVKTLPIDNMWNFAIFKLYTECQQKSYNSKRYSTDFRNVCDSSKMLRVGIWAESFRCACILLWQWQGDKFANRQHLKFCHFQPVHCASKKSYMSIGTQPIFEIFSSARRCSGWAFGWKLSCLRRYFTFAMARWKLCASTTFEI